jgi:hypothetical protein
MRPSTAIRGGANMVQMEPAHGLPISTAAHAHAIIEELHEHTVAPGRLTAPRTSAEKRKMSGNRV